GSRLDSTQLLPKSSISPAQEFGGWKWVDYQHIPLRSLYSHGTQLPKPHRWLSIKTVTTTPTLSVTASFAEIRSGWSGMRVETATVTEPDCIDPMTDVRKVLVELWSTESRYNGWRSVEKNIGWSCKRRKICLTSFWVEIGDEVRSGPIDVRIGEWDVEICWERGLDGSEWWLYLDK